MQSLIIDNFEKQFFKSFVVFVFIETYITFNFKNGHSIGL